MKRIPADRYFSLIRAQLDADGEAWVRVTGVSMQPMLRHMEDTVRLVPCGVPRAGDVVLFDRQNGRYALHRVIRVRDGRFSMMGDNQWHMERGLPCAQIMGRVADVRRGGRTRSTGSPGMKLYAVWAVPRAYLRWLIGAAGRRLRRLMNKGNGGTAA